ncbi:MAG: hypothetical protein GF320_13275 [Armatimonadia bacterium]|nr:hypothetical protein [Armatimonadia bacterium]
MSVRLLCALALPMAAVPGFADDWSVDLESGVASNVYNVFRVPGDTGTLVELHRDYDVDPTSFTRLRITYRQNERETWSALYAPLAFRAGGRATEDISFNGDQFAQGTPLSIEYVFNSYRLSWTRKVHDGRNVDYGFGLTAKIRDARIGLRGGGVNSVKTDLGFVPLINFFVDWDVDGRVGLVLEGEALAGPVGRAEDVQLAATYRLSDSADFRLGFRIVEGGADVDEVFNFSQINYLSAGLTWEF